MGNPKATWPEVGAAIRARLGQLPESERRIAARIGISGNTFRRLRDGKEGNYRASTLTRLSLGLWGTPDALARVMDGLPPTEGTEAPGLIASGWGDLNELRTLDREAYESLMGMVRVALDRARAAKDGPR